METKHIEFQSKWGVTLHNKFIDENSDVLTVLLPGMGYLQDKPLLHYSHKIVMEFNSDVLYVNYGFQLLNKPFENEQLDTLIDETFKIVNSALKTRHKKIIFIGKSLGTVIQSRLAKKFENYKKIQIMLTPIDGTFERAIDYETLVITGTSDPWISKESVKYMEGNKNIKLVKIENGNHSLEAINVFESLEMLKKAVSNIKIYLEEKVKM